MPKTDPLNCPVDVFLKRRIKVFAVQLDTTIAQIVNDALTDYADNVLPARVEALEDNRKDVA